MSEQLSLLKFQEWRGDCPLPRRLTVAEWLTRCLELGLTAVSLQRVDEARPAEWVATVRLTDRTQTFSAWAFDLETALGFAVEWAERDFATYGRKESA